MQHSSWKSNSLAYENVNWTGVVEVLLVPMEHIRSSPNRNIALVARGY